MRRIALLVLVLAFSIASSAQSERNVDCARGGGFSWMIGKSALHHLETVVAPAQLKAIFDTPCTYLLGVTSADTEYQNWRAKKTKVIRSIAEAEHCCDDPDIGAVLYDPEAWKFTPKDEQRSPGEATCSVAELVHLKGRVLLASPATNLAAVMDGEGARRRGAKYDAFARLGIASSVARCADVYEIQAQQTEDDLARFTEFVRKAAAQAKEANPKIVVLVGLSTNPNGRRVTGDQLFAAVKAVRGDVSGFWLNIPGGSEFCPQCGEPQPAVAGRLLQLLGLVK